LTLIRRFVLRVSMIVLLSLSHLTRKDWQEEIQIEIALNTNVDVRILSPRLNKKRMAKPFFFCSW